MGAAVREILRFLEHFDIQLTWDAADIFLSRYSIHIRYILCRCIYMNILYVYIHHNPIHVCVKDADDWWVFKFFFSHPCLESLLQEFPCENLRYTTSGEFMMRKLAELRSFQAREEVDLDGLLKHFMTPPSQEKEALIEKMTVFCFFQGNKNTIWSIKCIVGSSRRCNKCFSV